MFTVGITGGIGSGKTTVTTILQKLGVEVVDADLVAREVVKPGTQGLAEISHRYGAAVLLANGELNRPALRDMVFTKPGEKQWLEALLHPMIIGRCQELLKHVHSAYGILSSPLLIESGQYKLVSRVMVVDVPEQVQLSRTTARDRSTPQKIQQIIDSQISREERLRHADDVIDNSRDELHLREAVERLHVKYLELAQQHTNHHAP